MKTLPFFFPLFLLACTNAAQKKVEPVATKPAEHIDPTPEQLSRRQRSEAYCRAHGVPIYTSPNALFTTTDSAVALRTKDEIVDRALAILYIGLKGEGKPAQELAAIYKDWHIMGKLSPKEKEFVETAQPSSQQRSDATWRYESLHVLLWATGFIDSLSYPDKQCDVDEDLKIMYTLTEPTFRAKARLRSKKEILDQADLVLRMHWATEDARMNGKAAPATLIPDILMERHYVLNWLIRDLDKEWDDVETNT